MHQLPIGQHQTGEKGQAGMEGDGTGVSLAPPKFDLAASRIPPQSPPAANPDGEDLPDPLIQGFLETTGHDLSGVTVQRNSPEPAKMGALAYAYGNEIYLALGQEKQLAHEAAHIVQQREGRVPVSYKTEGKAVNEDPVLEKEADAMAAKAMASTGKSKQRADNRQKQAGIPILQHKKADPPKALPPFLSYDQLLDVDTEAFEKYVQQRPDWHTNPTLTAKQRQRLMHYANLVNRNQWIGKLNFYVMRVILAEGEKIGDRRLARCISTFSRGLNNDEGWISQPLTPADLVRMADGIQKLEQRMPSWMLKDSLRTEDFELLVKHNLLQKLADYFYHSAEMPYFQPNGKDYTSFVALHIEDGKDILKFTKSVLRRRIRNFHRFRGEALVALEKNYQDRSRSKPLLLFLQGVMDGNGALNRDPYLHTSIARPQNLTLLIEGKDNLKSTSAEVLTVAKDYGKNGKIDQFMFLGHGSGYGLDIAGKPRKDPKSKNWKWESKILEWGKKNSPTRKEAHHFLGTLVGVMNQQPPAEKGGARIGLAACRTNEFQTKYQKLPEDPKELRAYLLARMRLFNNITEFVRYYLQHRGLDKMGVRGTNTKVGPMNYTDSKGHLHMHDPKEPAANGSRLEYLEDGTQPESYFLNLIPVWLKQPDKALQAVTSRLTNIGGTHNDEVIKAMIRVLVRHYWKDVQAIALASEFAGAVMNMDEPDGCQVVTLDIKANKLRPDILVRFLAEFSQTPVWQKNYPMQIALYQVWLGHAAAAVPGARLPEKMSQAAQARLRALPKAETSRSALTEKLFLAMERYQTATELDKWIWVGYLEGLGLMQYLLQGKVRKGRLLLALLDVKYSGTEGSGGQFLKRQKVNGKFPAHLKINQIAKGITTQDQL